MVELLAFAIVFATIAGFEFLDRTNFALISFAARQPPFAVWAGAAAAFLVTTVIAVVIGGVAVALLRPEIFLVRLAGGILLLTYAGYLVLVPESERTVPAGRSVLTTAFLMIFLLELADTTMILTIGFVATYADPFLVGLAATLGLWTVAGTACILGPHIGARVEPKILEKVVIVVLVLVGVATVVYAVDPGVFPSIAG